MLTLNPVELGPVIGSHALDFCLPDHSSVYHGIDDLMGSRGLLLGFIGNLWQPTSVRRILWIQRHVTQFARIGTPIALLICDYPHTLYGFHTSSPLPVPFPLLADADGGVHRNFQMHRKPGLLLVDPGHTVREKWLIADDRVWPKVSALMDAVNQLQKIA